MKTKPTENPYIMKKHYFIYQVHKFLFQDLQHCQSHRVNSLLLQMEILFICPRHVMAGASSVKPFRHSVLLSSFTSRSLSQQPLHIFNFNLIFSFSKKTNPFKKNFRGGYKFVGKGYPRIPLKLSHHQF